MWYAYWSWIVLVFVCCLSIVANFSQQACQANSMYVYIHIFIYCHILLLVARALFVLLSQLLSPTNLIMTIISFIERPAVNNIHARFCIDVFVCVRMGHQLLISDQPNRFVRCMHSNEPIRISLIRILLGVQNCSDFTWITTTIRII